MDTCNSDLVEIGAYCFYSFANEYYVVYSCWLRNSGEQEAVNYKFDGTHWRESFSE